MILTTTQTIIIAVMFAIGTMITRFLPFILFKANKANNYISVIWDKCCHTLL